MLHWIQARLRWLNQWKLSIILTLSLLLVVFLVFSNARYVGALTPADAFSLGQFVVAILLIPIAIIGFDTTIKEFRKTHIASDLDLCWKTDDGPFTKSISVDRYIGQSFGLVLLNKGDVAETVYSVDLEVDFWLGVLPHSDHPSFLVSEIIAGDESNWWCRPDGDVFSVTHTSNGQNAAYPNRPLELAKVEFNIYKELAPLEEYQSSYTFPYKIFSEKGAVKKGYLTVSLRAGW